MAESAGPLAVVELNIRAPNSVLLLGDPDAEPPATMGGQLVSATGSCLAIGTRSDVDGGTRVRVLEKLDPRSRAGRLAVDCVLGAPNGRLALTSILGDTYAELPVSRQETRVQVWVSDQREPDAIDLVIEGVEDGNPSHRDHLDERP